MPPDALSRALTRHCGQRLLDQAVARPGAAFSGPGARMGVRTPAGVVLIALLAACLLVGLVAPLNLLTVPATLLSLVLLVPSGFRLWAAFMTRRVGPLRPHALLGDPYLPIYTVLIPLRDEAHMVEQLARALSALDYPPEKLDIKFVVESTGPETVAAVARHTHDPRFSLVVVPEGGPATKPKALNYALPLARGRHVVIFDAEDVPEPDQLRKAASLFAERADLACLQASLTIDNADASWVATMFAAEYAGQFQVLLPAIGEARLPMPLGGSSNHFRIEALTAVGGWDPFNVTEDADLGLRLARKGLYCAALDSHTHEEAPVDWRSWHTQRGRWMKGWMQTLIVHNHAPRRLLDDLGPLNLLAVNIFVGGMVLSTALHGAFLASLAMSTILQLALVGGWRRPI